MAELQPGVYERLITAGLDEQLRQLASELVDSDRLDPADADVVLARHLGLLARRALRSLPERSASDDRDLIDRQVALANRIAATIIEAAPEAGTDSDLVAAGEQLREILQRTGAPGPPRAMARPEVPLSTSALLVNGRDQPRIGSEVQRELASADRVDLLCAFVKWQGLRVLEDQLAALVRRRRAAGDAAPPLRVIAEQFACGERSRRALRPPSGAGIVGPPVLPGDQGPGRRPRCPALPVRRPGQLRQAHRRPPHAHHLEAPPRAARRRLPLRPRRHRLTSCRQGESSASKTIWRPSSG